MSRLSTRDKVRRTVVALVVLACLGGVAVAVASTREVDPLGEEVRESGDAGDVTVSGDHEALGTLPPVPDGDGPGGQAVERLYPPSDSQQLQGVQAGIDLAARWTGTLVVNGVEVPESQLVRRPETNQVFFTPGPGLVLEEWYAGRNCVRAVIWEVTGSREDGSRTVDWCFEVT